MMHSRKLQFTACNDLILQCHGEKTNRMKLIISSGRSLHDVALGINNVFFKQDKY